MPKKMGRPKVPKSKAFNPGFSLRLRPEDDKVIRKAIERSGQKQSDWLREALLEKAAKTEKLRGPMRSATSSEGKSIAAVDQE